MSAPLRPDRYRVGRPSANTVALIAIVLLAFALRGFRLDGQSLWSDESISLQRSSLPLLQMLATMPVEHAPGYFVLLNLWLRVAGTSDFALRFPSLLFGVLAVPLVASLGTTAFRRSVGVVAALVLAVNPLHVWYGQDARMYTMVVAFATGALWALLVALRTNRARAWSAYVALSALALYTHYYGAIIMLVSAACAIGILVARSRQGRSRVAALCPALDDRSSPAGDRLLRPVPLRRLWRSFAFSEVAVAVLFLPWLPRALGVLAFPGWRPPPDVGALPALLLTRYFLGTSVPPDLAKWVVIGDSLLLALGGAVLVRDWRRRRFLAGVWLIASGIAVWLSVIALIVWWKADTHERYFLAVTPLLYLAVARGIDWLHRPSTRSAWLIALVFVLSTSAWSLHNHYTDTAYAKADYREYTRHIISAGTPGDALVLFGPGRWLTKRYGGDALPKIYNLLSTENRDKTKAEIETLLANIGQQHQRVWLAVEGRDPGYVKRWLDEHGFLIEGGWRVGLQLYEYAFDTAEPLPRPVETVVGTPGVAATAAVTPTASVAGDMLLVILTAEAPRAVLPVGTRLSLRLVGAENKVYASFDGEPWLDGLGESSSLAAPLLQARLALPIPTNIPPGQYRVIAVLYPPQDLTPIATATLTTVQVNP
jgi:mannosyltransferase